MNRISRWILGTTVFALAPLGGRAQDGGITFDDADAAQELAAQKKQYKEIDDAQQEFKASLKYCNWVCEDMVSWRKFLKNNLFTADWIEDCRSCDSKLRTWCNDCYATSQALLEAPPSKDSPQQYLNMFNSIRAYTRAKAAGNYTVNQMYGPGFYARWTRYAQAREYLHIIPGAMKDLDAARFLESLDVLCAQLERLYVLYKDLPVREDLRKMVGHHDSASKLWYREIASRRTDFDWARAVEFNNSAPSFSANLLWRAESIYRWTKPLQKDNRKTVQADIKRYGQFLADCKANLAKTSEMMQAGLVENTSDCKAFSDLVQIDAELWAALKKDEEKTQQLFDEVCGPSSELRGIFDVSPDRYQHFRRVAAAGGAGSDERDCGKMIIKAFTRIGLWLREISLRTEFKRTL